MVHHGPSFFGQSIGLHSTSHEVNGLCGTDQWLVERIVYQCGLQFTKCRVRVGRSLDKGAKVCREILGVFCYALDCGIDGSATIKVRFDRICLKPDEEACKDADTLWKVSDRTHQKRWWLTVCGGGTLECPPEVATITLVFTRPFSAMLGTAMTEPPISPYAPARAI